MIIECVASTPDRDVTGETVNIDGADISPLKEHRGYLNSDHRNDMAHTVGKVLDAKIIRSLKDCDTPTQMKYWNQLGKSFIWAKGELFEGVGHKEADAIAAIYKFYMQKGEEPPVKISVEGKTLERGPNGELKRTLIKGLALTLSPCNRATRSEVTEITKSVGADLSLVKSENYSTPFFTEVSDDLQKIEKVLHLAETAREMLQGVRNNVAKAENKGFRLQSPALLERLKSFTSALRKKSGT